MNLNIDLQGKAIKQNVLCYKKENKNNKFNNIAHICLLVFGIIYIPNG